MSTTCQCPLNTEIEVPFFGRRFATVIFVGESPGKDELVAGRPFVGRSGKLLRKAISAAKTDMSLVAFANSARCLVDTKNLKQAEINRIFKACRHHLEELFAKVQPKIIVPVGEYALRQVLNMEGITLKRGKLFWSYEFNCWAMPVLHPSFILRNMSMYQVLADDMIKLEQFISSGYDPASVRPAITPHIVDTIAPLLARADNEAIYIGLDTETQGLDPFSPDCYMISYSIGISESEGYQIFLRRRVLTESTSEESFGSLGLSLDISNSIKTVEKCDNYNARLNQLKHLLEHPNVHIYMQHGVFDLHFIRETMLRAGIEPPVIKNYDVEIQSASHCLDENRFKQPKLEAQARYFCNYDSAWKDEFEHKYNKSSMIDVAPDDLAKYAVEDSCVTRSVATAQLDLLSKQKRLRNYFEKFVMPSVSVALYTLEANGVHIDQEALPKVKAMISEKLAEAEHDVFALCSADVLARYPRDVKLSKDAFIHDQMFSKDGFGLEPPKLTAKGAPAFNKESRALMLNQDIPEKAKDFLLAYERWSEWHGLSIRSMKQITNFLRADGRVHASYSSCQAVTGRVSCSSPNLMNIVKRSEQAATINKLFSVPDDSWEMIEADLSQAELRLISEVSGDNVMLQVYKDDLDIHTETAKALSKTPWDQLSSKQQKEIRTRAKPANFSIVYGSSVDGFKNYCLTAYGLHIEKSEAKSIMDKWFKKYNRIPVWHERVIERVRRLGYNQNIFGRIRRLPDILSQDIGLRSAAERQAINFDIQGPSSDMALLALIKIIQDPDMNPAECKPILFIHDSLTFQVKKRYRDKYVDMVRRHMEHPPLKEVFGVELSVPIKTDIVVGPNRGELEPYEK